MCSVFVRRGWGMGVLLAKQLGAGKYAASQGNGSL